MRAVAAYNVVLDQAMDHLEWRRKAAVAKRESKHVDFKATFDPTAAQDWCELVKDIVAMANSGGGVIVLGVADDGSVAQADLAGILTLDSAVVTEKVFKYTGEPFSDFEIAEVTRHKSTAAAMSMSSVPVPLVFTSPGTYDIGAGKQKTAFARGTIYFRHGAKSEPGTTQDLRQAVERELEHIRKSWLGGIRRVVTAPAGHTAKVLPPEVTLYGSADATPIRLVHDKDAPSFRAVRTDELYPHRLTELIARVKAQLPGVKITTFDVQCVRAAFAVDKDPNYFYKPQFSSPQYSDAFVDWIVAKYKRDPAFLEAAKQTCKKAK